MKHAPHQSPAPAVITPGNHDGVHLGHRALVAAARERASAHGWRTIAMFFDPHPTTVLAPERAPAMLTTPARRAELLRGAGADEVAIVHFDRAFSMLEPEQFARDVLVAKYGARGVVVGPDFRFGHARAGDVAMLKQLGNQLGFDVVAAAPVLDGGEPISSSRVRRAVVDGDVAAAARFLARVHDVSGEVIVGDRRGRTIGFPTANLACDPVLLPADGVYAIVARVLGAGDAPEGALLHGVANLGVRPTFAAGRSVEAHLFDFDGDLYGRRLRVGFVARVRGEQKFDGVEALVAQITHDARVAREGLAAIDPELLAWI